MFNHVFYQISLTLEIWEQDCFRLEWVWRNVLFRFISFLCMPTFPFSPPENIKKPKVFRGYKMIALMSNSLTKFWPKKGNFLIYKSVAQINLKIATNLLWISTSFRKWEHSINSIKILYNIKWQQLLLMQSKYVEQSAWKTISQFQKMNGMLRMPATGLN